MIEDGKVTQPIKGAMLIGNGPDAMHRVTMIGNDMKLDTGIGMCGKAGQGVPVGVGQPHLRMNQMTRRRHAGVRMAVHDRGCRQIRFRPRIPYTVLDSYRYLDRLVTPLDRHPHRRRHLGRIRRLHLPRQGRHLVEGRLSRRGDAARVRPRSRQGARFLQHAPARHGRTSSRMPRMSRWRGWNGSLPAISCWSPRTSTICMSGPARTG